jgi:hypothetical protein
MLSSTSHLVKGYTVSKVLLVLVGAKEVTQRGAMPATRGMVGTYYPELEVFQLLLGLLS